MGQLTMSLVRHGKTLGNLRGAYVGRLDHPLEPEGREELRELVARGCYPAVQAVFCSPLTRCRQTAEIVYPQHPPHVVKDLQERDFGDFEGKTHDEIIALPGYEHWGMNSQSMVFPGGEEIDAFFARCNRALWEIAELCVERGVSDVAVVAHGGVIMALLAESCEPRREYYDWFCGNGRGYLLECEIRARKLVLKRSLGD